jgi:hypothetical protein
VAAAALLIALAAAISVTSKRARECGAVPRTTSPVVRDSSYGSYSSSALGHEAFFELLRERKPFVERRVAETPLPSGPFSALVITDLEGFLGSDRDFDELGRSRGRVLAVLPKWRARDDSFRSGWVKDARPFYSPPNHLLEALGSVGLEEGAEPPPVPEIIASDSPQTFALNATGVEPDFGGNPVQLMTPPGLIPIVASRDGVLVGELLYNRTPRIWIVSDPDLTSNHGITRGQNLRFALKLAELWTEDLPYSAEITFDESHLKLRDSGSYRPSLWPSFRNFFSFRDKGPILLAFLAALLLLLFGMKRMWPEVRRPETSFGKAGLIANTALILERGPLRLELFRRFMDSVISSAARALKAPPAARRDRRALVEWLDSRSPSGGPWNLKKLAAEAERELSLPSPSASRLLFFAGRLHLWKEGAEIGPGTGGKDHGRRARRSR